MKQGLHYTARPVTQTCFVAEVARLPSAIGDALQRSEAGSLATSATKHVAEVARLPSASVDLATLRRAYFAIRDRLITAFAVPLSSTVTGDDPDVPVLESFLDEATE